jgi:hypothetical protein
MVPAKVSDVDMLKLPDTPKVIVLPLNSVTVEGLLVTVALTVMLLFTVVVADAGGTIPPNQVLLVFQSVAAVVI